MNKIPNLFLFFALLSLAAACKKDDQTTPIPSTVSGVASTVTTCRLSEITWAGKTPTGETYTYDNQGRVIKMKDSSSGREGTFTYADNGDLLAYTINNVDSQGRTYSSEVRKFTHVNGRLTAYAYNLVVKGRVEIEHKVAIALNATGHIASLQFNDGKLESYSYDYDSSGNLILLTRKTDNVTYEVEEYANYDTQRNPFLAVATSEAHKLIIYFDGIDDVFSQNNVRTYKQYSVDTVGKRTLTYEEIRSNFLYNQSDFPTQFISTTRTPQGVVSTTGTYSLSYSNCQ